MKPLSILTLGLLLLAATTQAQQPGAKPKPAQAAGALPPAKPEARTEATVPDQPSELSCRILTGRVTDKFAYPLTGATVMLRRSGGNKPGASDAFSTNAEGQYMLTSKQPIPRNTILEITAAGFTSLEVPLINCQPLDVTLEPLPGTRFKSDGRIKKTKLSGKIH